MSDQFTNRGSIMKMVLSPGARIENHGTIMHMDADGVSDVTIIQHGTIMHANGCTIIKGNGSLHTDAVREVIREVPRRQDLQRIEELEKECARLRAQNETIRNSRQPKDEDIYWGRKRIKEQKYEIERLKVSIGILKSQVQEKDETIFVQQRQIIELRNKDIIRHLDSENESLHEQVAYFENLTNELRCEVSDLKAQIAGTDRPELLKIIDDLKANLKRAKNRETVQKQRADHEAMRAFKATQHIWDEYRPTKEQVKAYYRTIRNMMDVETDY